MEGQSFLEADLGSEDEEDEDYEDDDGDDDEDEDQSNDPSKATSGGRRVAQYGKGKGGGKKALLEEIRERKMERLLCEIKEEDSEAVKGKMGRRLPLCHSDDFMRQFQLRCAKPQGKANSTTRDLNAYIGLVSNVVADGSANSLDVEGLKQRSRQGVVHDHELLQQAVVAAGGGDKVKVSETVRYGSEIVTLERTMQKGSAEMKAYQRRQDLKKKRELGGQLGDLDKIMNEIHKPQSVNSMEKSAVEWRTFKGKEGIEDELRQQRQQEGYLSRQAFLARSSWKEHAVEVDAKRRKQTGN